MAKTFKEIKVLIDPGVHQAIKDRCYKQNITMSQFVIQCMVKSGEFTGQKLKQLEGEINHKTRAIA